MVLRNLCFKMSPFLSSFCCLKKTSQAMTQHQFYATPAPRHEQCVCVCSASDHHFAFIVSQYFPNDWKQSEPVEVLSTTNRPYSILDQLNVCVCLLKCVSVSCLVSLFVFNFFFPFTLFVFMCFIYDV